MVRVVTDSVKVEKVVRKSEFGDRLDHERKVVAEATHFTAVLFAPGGASRRLEASTLEEAKSIALGLRSAFPTNARDVLIYAVSDPYHTLVCSLSAKGEWKGTK